MLKRDNVKIYKLLFGAICLFIFVVMLWCNLKTPLICDDFRYLFTFNTNGGIKRVETIWDIFPSMSAHRIQMNGRDIPHFFVQLSLMLPLWIFDLVNSGVFLLMILLIVKCAFLGRENMRDEHPVYSLLLLTAVFACIWLLEPSFGQVNLWQDGAVNYLWSSVVSLASVFVFLRLLLKGEYTRSIPGILAIAVMSFACGAWSENASGAVLILIVFVLLYERFIKKQKIHWSFWLYLAATLAGFLYMVSAPAEFSNKVSEELSIFEPIWLLPKLSSMLSSFGPLWIAAVVLITLAVVLKVKKETIFAALLLFLCALASCICLTLGSYIAERSFFFTVTLLVLICAMLCTELLDRCAPQIFCLLTVCLLFLPASLISGIMDIGTCNSIYQQNEAYIYEAAASGQTEILIDDITADTKNCAFYGLRYLNLDDPTSWPNDSMAKYYGVDLIY